MSDVAMLLLVVGAIYLSECARWVQFDTVLFSKQSLRGWRYRYPGGFVRNEKSALALGNVLPPLTPSLVTQWWPISMSPDAVLALAAQEVHPNSQTNYTQRLVALDDIQNVYTYESDLLINGQAFAELCSPQLATWFAKLIRSLVAAPKSSRAELIDRALNRALSSRKAERRFRQASRRAANLRLLCNTLFIVLVVAIGLMVEWTPTRWLWPYFLLVLFILWVCTVREFRRVFRKLHPQHATLWRSHGLMMFLSPLAALRGYDFALRDVLSLSQPLAAAQALCNTEELLPLARQAYCDLKFSCQRDKSDGTLQQLKTFDWFHSKLSKAIERRLLEWNIDATELIAPPVAEGEDAVSYCPRCRSQYVLIQGMCSHCNGIELLPFEWATEKH